MSLGDSPQIQQSQGEKDLAQLSMEQWNDYKNRFTPVENQFVQDVQKDQGDRNRAMGSAVADTSQAFDKNMNAQAEAGSVGHLVDTGLARAKSQAGNTVSATNAVDAQNLQGLSKAVSLGRNVADDANLGFRNVARMSAATAAADARAQATKNQGIADFVGTVAGAASGWGLGRRKAPGTKDWVNPDTGKTGIFMNNGGFRYQ